MQKRKLVRRIGVGLVVLVIGAGLAGYIGVNHLVKRTIEVQATSSLSLQTTLSGVSLSLLGGNLGLDDLQIASPTGFNAPHMLALEAGAVQVSYGELMKNPVHVSLVTLKGPKVVLEQAGGKFNFQHLMNLPPTKDPLEVVIDKLVIEDANVVLRAGLPGLENELVVPVARLELEKIGTGEGSQNGVALRQVALEVITALAAKTGHANLPKQLQEALQKNVQAAAGQLSKQAQQQIEQFAKPLDEVLKGKGIDVGGLLDQQINKALGGNKKRDEKAKQ